MISLPLQIRYSQQPRGEPAAWFIAGADPEVWLEELAGWGVPLAKLQLYIVPQSTTDLRAAGVVIPWFGGMKLSPSSRATAYVKIAPRLYVPAEARLEPTVTDEELERQLFGDLNVFHPAVGMIAFHASDALRVCDLLQIPPQREVNWNFAQPGVAPAARLLSVAAEEVPLDPVAIIEQGRDDIGTQARQELPPAPQEPATGAMADLARQGKSALARAVNWLTSFSPPSASQPTWINHLENWARRTLAGINESLQNARDRELNRLLHLLETNADEGLRFALPLESDASRGLAQPGANLGPREVNFNLNRMGGGGAADPWYISQEKQRQLSAKYRELANREIQLGRHRRAAYIYAELLHDFSSAASVLEQGGHFHEAAVLYRERLHAPLKAARCLEQAGAWDEAVELYRQEREFETAGDLLAKLERPDEAEECYRAAVGKHVASRNSLAAATLLEQKIHVPDEALTVLTAAWPASPQAGACLEARFALLGRLGRHDDAARLPHDLAADVPAGERGITLITTLSRVHDTYPARRVRDIAADTTRVLAGNRLRHATDRETQEVLRAVRSLAPEDELLGRDTSRFANRKPHAVAPRPEQRAVKKQPVLVRKFEFDQHTRWKCAATASKDLYIAGYTNAGIVVNRLDVSADPENGLENISWRMPVPSVWNMKIELALHPGQPTIVSLLGGPRLPLQSFADQRSGRPTQVGTPLWMPEGMSVAYNEQGIAWSVRPGLAQGLVLTSRRTDGTFIASRDLTPLDADGRPRQIDHATAAACLIVARRDKVFVACGESLMVVAGNKVQHARLPGEIRQMVVSLPHSNLRVAVSFADSGGQLIWNDMEGLQEIPFAEDLPRADIVFTRDGSLVAASHYSGRVYSTADRKLVERIRFDGAGQRPLAVLRGPGAREFVLVANSGEAYVYQIPEA
jgi:tetratricopeptide (TPR) repeat protein